MIEARFKSKDGGYITDWIIIDQIDMATIIIEADHFDELSVKINGKLFTELTDEFRAAWLWEAIMR